MDLYHEQLQRYIERIKAAANEQLGKEQCPYCLNG